MLSASRGLATSIFWKRRARGRSRSKEALRPGRWWRRCSAARPLASTGLSRLEASMVPPLTLPAPTRVWISSMKSSAPGLSARASSTALTRCSKSPAVAGPRQQRAHVQGEEGHALEGFGHLALVEAQGQPLGDGRLAHAGLAHQQRVVLPAAAEDVDHPLQLLLPADQRIDAALGGLLARGPWRRPSGDPRTGASSPSSAAAGRGRAARARPPPAVGEVLQQGRRGPPAFAGSRRRGSPSPGAGTPARRRCPPGLPSEEMACRMARSRPG